MIEILTTHGHDESLDEFASQEPLLAACVASSLPHPARKLGGPTQVKRGRVSQPDRSAWVDYYSLHANTRIRAGERKRLEKLCRCVARPPVSNDLLVELASGQIAYKLKRSW